MLPQAATDFYALQQRVSKTTADEVRRIWRRRMGDDFDASWERISPAILHVIAEGQSQMALRAPDYTRNVLDDLDIPDRPEGEFVPDSLVGMASDGRRLDSLAAQSVVAAKTAIHEGGTTQQALDQGGEWLHLMAALQVADVARVAVGIGAAARKNIAGHVRVLNLPVCQRCAVLGGRFYRWSTGFDRHPRDDCTMMPVKSEDFAFGNDLTLDPVAAMKAGGIKDLTEAQTKAIAEGAQLNDVVNAYRGMSTTATGRKLSDRAIHMQEKAAAARAASVASGMPDLLGFIPKSVLERGYQARLTPEGIYRLAGSDRGQAIQLLRREGYIA